MRATRRWGSATLAGVIVSMALAGCQPPPPPGHNAVYVHYYLWWSVQHWQDKLGAGYPYGASPAPAPGSMDSSGCNPQVRYPGSTIVDVPSEGLYNQDVASTFDLHIAEAVQAGLRGFLVSWQGTGATGQSPSSSSYNSRLDTLAARVNAYNLTHGADFGLGLAFASYGNYARPASAVVNDLRYFAARYGSNPAFRNSYSNKPLTMLLDSRKWTPLVGSAGAVLPQAHAAVDPSLYLVGDETASSWPADAPYLDATSYYWSSENPWTNSSAQSSVDALGAEVHAAGKRWFPPVIAGYDKQLVGGQCVPRDGIATLDKDWAVNKTSNPDGWFAISWNEFVENTYIEPSANYGSKYLNELGRLARNG